MVVRHAIAADRQLSDRIRDLIGMA